MQTTACVSARVFCPRGHMCVAPPGITIAASAAESEKSHFLSVRCPRCYSLGVYYRLWYLEGEGIVSAIRTRPM